MFADTFRKYNIFITRSTYKQITLYNTRATDSTWLGFQFSQQIFAVNISPVKSGRAFVRRNDILRGGKSASECEYIHHLYVRIIMANQNSFIFFCCFHFCGVLKCLRLNFYVLWYCSCVCLHFYLYNMCIFFICNICIIKKNL